MTDPTEPTPTADPDAAWFRTQVDPVLEAEPVADAWSEIEARVGGAAPSPSFRRPRARWFAAAAVVVLIAGLVAFAVTASDDETDTDSLTTDQPEPTGWYAPVGLPEGWQLESVEAYPGRKRCAHEGAQWSDPAQDRSLLLEFDACGKAITAADVPDVAGSGIPDELPRPTLHEVDLGSGVTASAIRNPNDDPDIVDIQGLTWNADGGAFSMRALGLGYDQQVAIAKRILTDPKHPDPGVPGLAEVDRWSAPASDDTPEVQVNLVNPDGLRTSYHLSLPGAGNKPGGSSVLVPVTVAGQPEPVFRYDTVGFWAGRYGGSWPGADLTVYRWTEGPTDPEHMITDAGLEQLLGALRPATAAEWRAFLATATRGVSPVLLDAPTLRSLVQADIPRPGEPGGELTSSTTTTTTTTTTTAASGAPDDGIRSSQGTAPGTPVPRADEDDRLTPLEDLEISLELENLHGRADGPSLAVGEVARAKLIVHNTSEQPVVLTECTLAFARWGLIPADDPSAALPRSTDDRCSAFPEETVPAGGTIRLPVDWRRPAGFVAQRPAPDGSGRYLGPLPGGAYLATFDVRGRTSDVRLQIDVDVPEPACPVADADVAPYLGLPRSEAQEVAKTKGKKLAMATLDGDVIGLPEGVDCDRVNVDVWLSEVVNAYVT